MNPPTSATNASLSHTVYTTASGRALLVRQILSQCKPVAIEPHDYQCEGICRALDGDDVVATMATGAGKTGLMSFLMLVVRTISQDPSLALQNRTFPKNPCMLVICPTKALEEDMVC
jgi:superfamily II DNA/RNA helicase